IGRWRKIGKLDEFFKLYDSCWYQRAFGDFWQHMLVAEGAVDIAVEPTNLKIWDIVAPALIVEEAGGKVTTITGATKFGDNMVSTNGVLHDQVIGIITPAG
ncbi:MAG TPA: inositol monophosphatase family protein, partial [Candidatus Polarisedimenticolaceae bacterium]|nr:inositol monophosphatase family protein [Candidatus Polarisedimenticolaceae bacterium]